MRRRSRWKRRGGIGVGTPCCDCGEGDDCGNDNYCVPIPADPETAQFRIVISGFVDGEPDPGPPRTCWIEQLNGTHDLSYLTEGTDENGCPIYTYQKSSIGSPPSHQLRLALGAAVPDQVHSYTPGCDDPVEIPFCHIWARAVVHTPQNFIWDWNDGTSSFEFCGEAVGASNCASHTVGTIDSITEV
jgi:hypothetical protein